MRISALAISKRRVRRAASSTARWVLLIHQIPPKPDYLRVKISRRLQRIGAVAIKNSVYVLPAGDATLEDFQWVLREITSEDGDGSVCHASFVDGLTDEEVEELFRVARSRDYEEVLDAARVALKASPARAIDADQRTRARGELARLRKRMADIAATDFFGAPARADAEEALGRLEVRLRAAAPAESDGSRERPGPAIDPSDVRGRTWVTRQGVFVDRIASAWLIRRRIDPGARFAFVPAEGYVPKPAELRFDMFEAEFTHEGDRCTFETLVARFGLQADTALRAVAEIVHDIDVKDAKFARAEAAGVERLLEGIAAAYPSDDDRLEHGAALFDGLYAAFRPATPATPPRTGRRRRS
ncbi:MAG TPA: chromate resistance protein ChrB domain-containing protein [Gemmatimonadaceae bacterium]|nr:chromate resistance protein ChrB domain-containing protein [Gemmatimonadaceae bacterium]